MIARDVAERDGIIFVRGTGAWTRVEIDDHLYELGIEYNKPVAAIISLGPERLTA